MENKLYVARDKDDALYIYLGYPTKSDFEYRHGTSGNQACIGSLPNKLFPEVTFDGGPVELILSREGFTSSRASLPESKMNLLL